MSLEKANRDYVDGFYHSQAGLPSADPGVESYRRYHDAQKSMFSSSTPMSSGRLDLPRPIAILLAVILCGGLFYAGVQKNGIGPLVLLGAVFVCPLVVFAAFKFVPGFWKAALYFILGFVVAVAIKLAIGKALSYPPTDTYVRAWLAGAERINSVFQPLNSALSLRSVFVRLSDSLSIPLQQFFFFVWLFFAISLLPWARRRMSLVKAVILFQVIIWLVPEILF